MAQYTRSITEQFATEEPTIGWLWRAFIFSGVVFGSVLLLYLGMAYGYEPYLNSQINDSDEKLKQIRADLSVEDQAALISFYSEYYNIKSLLGNHVALSGLLTFLEGTVAQDVYYVKSSYEAGDRSLVLNGNAASYEALAKQLEAFRARPELASVLLRSANFDEAKKTISFDVKIDFKSQFLSK